MKWFKFPLWSLGLIFLTGCSFVLDPTDCSGDSDCADGRCTNGICVSEISEADMLTGRADMGSVDSAVPPDMSMADALLADAILNVDMMQPEADAMIRNEPPECTIRAEATLVSGSEVLLTLVVSDVDNDVSFLEVDLNGSILALNEDGRYEGIFLIQEGQNDFQLIAVSNGQRCSDSITVISDQTSPRILDERPAIGETLKSANGRVFATATVVDEYFAPSLTVFVDGLQYEVDETALQWIDQTYLLELELDRGIHSVEVLVSDQVGNVSRSAVGRDCSVDSCAHTFTVDVDSEAPTIVLDSLLTDQANRIAGRSVRLTGSVIDSEEPVSMALMQVTVRPQMGAERVSALRADENGRFDQQIEVLDDASASAEIEICADDVAMNRGCISIEVEKQLPCINITTPEENVIIPSASVNVRGTICDGVNRVEFLRNGESTSFISVIGQDTFSRNLVLPTNGDHEITAVAYNDDLAESAQDSVNVSRDDSPPRLNITRPTPRGNGNPICSRSVFEVCVQASDPESSITALRLGSNQIPTNQIVGTVCRQTSVPTGAGQQFTAQATNGAGSVTERSITLNVDDVAPLVNFTQPVGIQAVNPWIKSDSGQIEVTGRIESGVCGVSAFFLDDTQINVSQFGTFQVVMNFEEGQQTVMYLVRDLAGNERSNNYAFRVDDTAPTLEFFTNTEDFTGDPSANLFIAASDLMSGVNTGSLQVNGENYGLTPISPSQAEREVQVELDEGVNEIEISVEDQVGNKTELTDTIIKDTTPPNVTIVSPVANQSIAAPAVVRGTIDDGENGIGGGSVIVNGVEAIVDFDTNEWVATNVEIEPTVQTIEVIATDALGNQSQTVTTPIRIPAFAHFTGTESGISETGFPVVALHPADFNGDNLIDFIELNDTSGRCLMQQSDGLFVTNTAEECGLPILTGYRCSQLADLDGDGRLDMLYFGANESGILLGSGDGSFLPSGINMVLDGTISDCAVVDLNRNGRLDIIALADNNAYVLFSNESDEFDLEPPINLGLDALNGYTNLTAVDLNNDGFMDIIASGGEAQNPAGNAAGMSIFGGSFGGAFQEIVVPNELPHVGGSERMVLPVDADQDGALELILLGASTVYFDRDEASTETFEFQKSSQLQASFADQQFVSRGDINADGRDDLLFFGGFGARLIQNFGDGVFGPLDNSFVGLGSLEDTALAFVVDMDGDGDEDWLLGASSGFQIWKSNQMQRDPNTRYIRVELRRHSQSEQFLRPADTHGPQLIVELLTEEELDADAGQLVGIVPERAIIPRLNVPTIISLGSSDGAHLEARFVDKPPAGSRIRRRNGVEAGDDIVIFSLE